MKIESMVETNTTQSGRSSPGWRDAYGLRPLPATRTWTLRNLVLPVSDGLMGHPMMRRLRLLERAQWWTPERLIARQNQLLQSVITTAYAEVPFWHDWMDAAGVRPEDIRSAEDLDRIPVVSKSVLRDAYPDRCIRTTRQHAREDATSGSTGEGFRILEDNETAGWYRASFMLAAEWAGWRIGEPHIMSGMRLRRTGVKALKDRVLGCHYVKAADLRDDRLDEVLDLIEKSGIRHVWGYPGFGYYLALHAEKRGWNTPLQTFVTWGDTLYPEYRATIERVFRTPVFDTYGCSEGFQVSAQCGHGSTYHVHDLDVIADLLDDGGRPVAPGEPGNVIITRLHAGAMPLIRYRVGDVAFRSDGQPCPCGRGFSTMGSIRGRDTDVIVTPSGNRLVIHFWTGVMKLFPDVSCFQLVQTAADRLHFRIVPRGALRPDTIASIIEMYRERGVDMEMTTEVVAEIPLTAGGKRRFIINELLQAPRPPPA